MQIRLAPDVAEQIKASAAENVRSVVKEANFRLRRLFGTKKKRQKRRAS